MLGADYKPITIFLSYSHKDQAACNDIHANLMLQGLDVKIDVNDINPGDSLKETITNLIGSTLYSIVVISENSLQSAWVIWEFLRRIELGRFCRKIFQSEG
jgi:hypothetical protein